MNKSNKESSNLFHSIMKASVKTKPKYAIRLKGDVYVGSESGGECNEVIGIDNAKQYIERINALSALENIKRHKQGFDFSKSEIIEVG